MANNYDAMSKSDIVLIIGKEVMRSLNHCWNEVSELNQIITDIEDGVREFPKKALSLTSGIPACEKAGMVVIGLEFLDFICAKNSILIFI